MDADLLQRVAQARRRSGARADPLVLDWAEALARRAQRHDGEVGRRLQARVLALLDGLRERAPRPPVPLPQAASRVAELRARVGAPADGAALKTVQAFGSSWTRLRTEHRLAQSLARAPEQAGPLNSHALLLRALQELQTLSPAYLDRLVAYADALLAIDAAGAAPERPPARPPARSPARGARAPRP